MSPSRRFVILTILIFIRFSNKFVPDTVSHMNFFKRYLFKKALLEDVLANEERRKKEIVIEKQPEPVAVVEPQVDEKGPAMKGDLVDSKLSRLGVHTIENDKSRVHRYTAMTQPANRLIRSLQLFFRHGDRQLRAL